VSSGLPRWRQIVDQIEREIRTGARAPGSQLPSLTAQQAAGYSQTTTLRAYQDLINRGLAVSIHGSGTFVADPPPDSEPTVTLQELAERVRRIEEHLGL
jgi:GntR family transcriptional regulator/MocR family aminotransferase